MIFWIFLIIALIVISLIIVYKIYNKKYYDFLYENSVAIKNLKELNDSYNFFTDFIYFNETHVYDNKNYYDTISCKDYLIYQLQFKQYEVNKQLNKILRNRQLYNDYVAKVKSISSFGNYTAFTEKLNLKRLSNLEEKIFNKHVLKPILDYTIHVLLNLSNLNGDIYESKNDTFNYEQIFNLIRRLNDKYGTYFRDTDVWTSICKVERARVSNKLRFAIYNRDGNKCCYCGSTKNLEIDHIKPISKGGKSTPDNLQTLCETCNKNKGNTF